MSEENVPIVEQEPKIEPKQKPKKEIQVKSEPEKQDNTFLYAAGAVVIGFLFWKWNK